MKTVAWVAVFAWAVMISGCTPKEEPAAPAAPQPQTVSRGLRATAPEALPQGDAMAARVNGAVVKGADVDDMLKVILGQYGGRIPAEQMEKIRPILWQQAREALINQQLLIQQADKDRIKVDEGAVDEQMKQIRQRLGGDDFQKTLASMGMTEAQLRRDLGQKMRIETLLDKKLGKIGEVKDEEVETYYREHPDEFKAPQRVRASHILLKTAPGESPEVLAGKRSRIAKLREEIIKGADFGKLAKENSECPSSAEGGDLGFFERGNMVKPFEDAAFGMKAGEVRDIVETEFGYHLIKVTGREEAQDVPLEKVRDRLTAYLSNREKQKATGDYIKGLRDSAKIEYPAGQKPAARGDS